jgi:hypothetical protein
MNDIYTIDINVHTMGATGGPSFGSAKYCRGDDGVGEWEDDKGERVQVLHQPACQPASSATAAATHINTRAPLFS